EVLAQVQTVKPLSAYANISTAYPDFEEQETVFEVRLAPVNAAKVLDLPTKSTFIVKQDQ
ncbi:MAG: hypothetical protein ACTIK3_06550, partial [Sphingobacteriaceae bacterium]